MSIGKQATQTAIAIMISYILSIFA